MSRPGDESFIDSRAAPSDPAALSEPTVAEEDGRPQSSRELDSAGQRVESPTHAELPVVGAELYTIIRKARLLEDGLPSNLTATGRHLPYGITQCYLPPDASERAPP